MGSAGTVLLSAGRCRLRSPLLAQPDDVAKPAASGRRRGGAHHGNGWQGRDGTAESRITCWIAEAAVSAVEPGELVRGLAEQLREEGLALGRLWVGADILHPTIGTRTVSWSRSRGLEATGFARNLRRDLDDPQWRATPLRLLLTEGPSEFRRRLTTDYSKGEFALLDGFLDAGLTDYPACAVRFPRARWWAIRPS